jgi:hypothetical protein
MRPVLFFILLSPLFARAFEIPKGLNGSDRQEVVRTLGLNSATKVLTNPYPLGGYQGFEIGVSTEFINVRDIGKLGAGGLDVTEWRYSRLTIGKGLYDDVDLFVHFLMPIGGVQSTDYGGLLRWSFYQARFLPINISLLVSADQLNFNDAFINRNVGADVIVGVNVDGFAVYFGGGQIHGEGTFTSSAGVCANDEDCTVDPSDPNVNAATRTVVQRVTENHMVVGLSLHFDDLFAAAEVDRYRDAVYSLKAGLHF